MFTAIVVLAVVQRTT